MIFNEEFETLPREVLETLQLKRLQQVVQRVYHTVGFYRKSFDEAGITPPGGVPGGPRKASFYY